MNPGISFSLHKMVHKERSQLIVRNSRVFCFCEHRTDTNDPVAIIDYSGGSERTHLMRGEVDTGEQ